MNTFKAGDRIKVVNMPEHVRNGMEATVAPIVGTEDNPVNYFIHFDDAVSLWMNKSHLELIHTTPKPLPPKDDYAGMSLEEQVAELTDDLYQVSRSYVAASTHRDRLQHDIDFFTSTMRNVKDVEGWCDDGTNNIISQLNGGFDVHYIEPYESEFEIEYEITAGVTTRGTVLVTASSEDAAREFFLDDPEAYITPDEEALDEARSTGWDSCEVELY